jgi:hypothetical protein
LDDIRLATGNEQLMALYNNKDELATYIDEWKSIAVLIEKRLPEWEALSRLAQYAEGLKDSEIILTQVEYIRTKRQLLDDPDPIKPLITQLTQLLRDELNRLSSEYTANHAAGMKRLEEDENWNQLKQEQKLALLSSQKLILSDEPKVDVSNTSAIIKTLQTISLSSFMDRVAAMPSRFETVATKAAELLEPEVKTISLSRRTLKSEEDIEAWLKETEAQLKSALADGPIRIS